MTATIIIAVLCAAGIVFMAACLMSLRREPRARAGRVERILPLSVIEWDVEVEESAIPGVKHAVPRARITGTKE